MSIKPKNIKILLCSIGSRGDIQPFLILGEYLSKQGYEVKVASAKMYQSLAANYEVEYISFEGDYESIMDDSKLKEKIGKNPFALGKALKDQVYPIIESSIDTFYNLSLWADVVLYHPKTMLDGVSLDQKHKLIKAYVVPLFTPTSAFTNPILMFLPIPRFLNRLSYKIANLMMHSLNKPVKKIRKKYNLPNQKLVLDTPTIYGISPSLLSRPNDYPVDHFYSGFWINKNVKQEISEEVKAFMSNKREVLIITFGSMPYQSKIDINIYVEALILKHKVKILIVKGWGLKDISISERSNLMVIDKAPFEQLFPLARYVIHHGGAGTTTIALKAGVPQMICPILHPVGDQFFWGKQLYDKKVGVYPVPLKKLTLDKLLIRFDQLKEEQLYINAQKIQNKIELENGLEETERIIKNHFDKQNKK